MFYGDAPDQTLEELLDNGEDDEFSLSEEDYEEIQEGRDELWDMVKYTMMAQTASELLIASKITCEEYVEYIEWIEAKADEDGVELP